MYFRVKSVQPLEDYLIRLTFADGAVKIFDVKPFLDRGLFAQLRDKSLFRSVHVSFDTVEWANGVDICPELMYDEGVPVTEEESAQNKVSS
jgi:hypothetical protein